MRISHALSFSVNGKEMRLALLGSIELDAVVVGQVHELVAASWTKGGGILLPCFH